MEELQPTTLPTGLETDSNPSDGEPRAPDAPELYVVGIGASAGGLESLERFFDHMPADTGLGFVVIQHLSPDFKSLMDELLSRHTPMPIHRAEEGMLVEPNSVYLIPPKKEMIISGGRLLLTDKDPKQALTMPIDRFFRSLAQDAGEHAIGVILSGTGSDGSRGIRDIHEAGGFVACESRNSAKFDGMPQAAIETGVVDRVLPPEEMPEILTARTKRIPRNFVSEGEPQDAATALFRLLNEECGIDFSHYKSNTVGRRIQRRLSIVGAHTLNDYVERLRRDGTELNALYKDLLIGVTRFFRDREAFAKLDESVIAELVRNAGEEEGIRIWVAGCATGEEAYSLAALIHEHSERSRRKVNAKIFATDVHRASLEFAAAGVYDKEALADVSPERLSRYFDQKRDGYHVVAELRQMIVFAAHNVISDAPFTKLDLITCRNLLIYFDPTAQKKAITLFHFGLKTGGVLFLGTSETPGELQDEFESIDPHWKIYRKCRDIRLPTELRLSSPITVGRSGSVVSPAAPAKGLPDAGLIGAYDAILAKHMPPALLINERRELLHAFGGSEQYLRYKSGRPSQDALELLDHDLRTAVTGAVQRALKENAPVCYSAVRVHTDHGERRLRVTVEPLINPRSRWKQLLIVLDSSMPDVEKAASASTPADSDMRQISRDRIESLEYELRHTKENLQTTIEELETSNEELQATNEELVASNEELQSTNEELQSVNEELFTVNAEYQKKITELSELTGDMDNLLASTEIGAVFLDADLCIRKFTPQIAAQFHLLPQDVSRPIAGFAHGVVYPELIDDMRRVLAAGESCEREVQDREGKSYLLRLLPYRRKAKIDGVVLTLIDVTLVKRAQAALADAVRRRDQFLAMLSHELRNPLSAVLSAANILELSQSADESLLQVGEVIKRQSSHMARLLDDLLDVSRITQNKIEMRKLPTPVDEIVAGAVESVRPLIESNRQKFFEEISHPPAVVHGDPVRLQQALSNVLVNAAKYTPAGGEIQLQVYQQDGEVVLRVSDNGVGIPPDQIDDIFDLFVQLDQPLVRSKGGMGVGLTLVRSIVEMHHGRVTAKSDGAGHGSQFEIRLPRMRSHERSREHFEKRPARADADCLKIVVIEDQDDNRRMLQALLELDGHHVFVAENGPRGLAAIEQHRPDLALVDIGLPGLSGYDVAKQVRECLGNRDVYLVALTGYGQPQDVQAAFAAGFDNHVVKPLDPQKLAQFFQHRKKSAPLMKR